VGIGIFTVASLLCGLAQSQEMLIAARFVQGGGGALASAVTLGMIVTMFPEPREQAKAIGVYGFVASAGGSIGLLVGGVLTDAISWHWIFFVNVPIGLLTAFLAMRLVAARPGIGIGEGADVPGAILVTSGLMLAVYTILGVEEHGWTSARTLILAAVSIALVAAFVLRQARIPKPLMPLRLFRSRNVAGANGIICALVVGMFGIFFLGALYMQLVLGYKPLEVGLAFLPATLIMGTLSLGFTDKVNMRFGPRNVLIFGLTFLIAAMLLMARTPVDGDYWVDLFPVMLLFGVGAGVSFPALMMLAMSGATPSDAGLASGLVNTTAQVGGAIGLAVLATVSAERTQSLLADGDSQAAALTGGFHVAYLIGAALAFVGIAAAVFVLRSQMPAEMAAGGAHGQAGPGEPEPAYSDVA
jgi:EmrB/QacA subfamily drug resistance transporter